MLKIEPVPKRVTLSSLIIETTRRCNMNCCHCLRGDSQNIDMDIKHVNALFKLSDRIDYITLSGGEPSLVPHILIKIIESARTYKTDIGSFYIATNGKVVSEEFIRALFEWWLFCSDGFENQNYVEISSDAYHEDIDINGINKLMAFRFVGTRDLNSNYNNGAYLIWEGRAAKNFASARVIDPRPIDIEYDDLIQGELYLDCLGNIHSTCDLSYKTMEEGEFCIGNISENNFNLINAIKSYNLKLEEVDYARTGT